jgi:alpha-tubulin suppressor-like RCC1 family protein
VTPANRAYCWGSNSAGQLGDGTTTQRLRPVPVTGSGIDPDAMKEPTITSNQAGADELDGDAME